VSQVRFLVGTLEAGARVEMSLTIRPGSDGANTNHVYAHGDGAQAHDPQQSSVLGYEVRPLRLPDLLVHLERDPWDQSSWCILTWESENPRIKAESAGDLTPTVMWSEIPIVNWFDGHRHWIWLETTNTQRFFRLKYD